MKVLAIVDIHRSEKALKTTLNYIEKYQPDILLILGDITTFGPLKFAAEFLANLPKIKTLAIPGNCDPREILTVIHDSSATNLHGSKVSIDGITFVGLGGSNYTPFNTPFELTEDEIYETLDALMEPGAILTLHGPAKGHLDLVPDGMHTGSMSVMKIIEKYRPSLVLSGHIHETRGTEIDESGVVYVNPGTMQAGYAALLNITPNFENTNMAGAKFKIEIDLLPKE